jgi:RNase E specificity factor CsrD
MMIRLPDFDLLRDNWGRGPRKNISLRLSTCSLPLLCATRRAAGALSPQRLCRAAAAPHAKRAESIAGQLLKAVDALPQSKMLDRDDMMHMGICAWRSGQSTEQVMEHAEAATRNAVLQGQRMGGL